MMGRLSIGTVSCVTFCILVAVAACWPQYSAAQGQYRPVTEEDVVALQLNHYFSPDKQHHDPDFEWRFTKDEFVLQRAKGEIPADLRSKLFPEELSADEIRGRWILKDGKIELSEIKAGKVNGRKKVAMPIYRTAPTVIRIGEPQYVFAVAR